MCRPEVPLAESSAHIITLVRTGQLEIPPVYESEYSILVSLEAALRGIHPEADLIAPGTHELARIHFHQRQRSLTNEIRRYQRLTQHQNERARRDDLASW